MAVPKLSLDRPFTYVLPDDATAGTGSLVSVPFHGRTIRGWVLGPAAEPPPGRLLPIRRIGSQVRFFDPQMLRLLRWAGERYVTPLCAVIERSHPPRVAGEERAARPPRLPGHARRAGDAGGPAPFGPYATFDLLEPATTTWLRPLPGEEATSCVAAVEECLRRGRTAIVLVPQADPLPFTARAVLDRFGGAAVSFVGGERRDRYRTWLDIQAGRYDVVVGTRPAVFSPLPRLGLIWISREAHPGHREERAPYYHVREVAAARCVIESAACVVGSLSPTVETAASVSTGSVRAARPPRAVERATAPLVETVLPEGEDRSTRLGTLLKGTRRGALIASRTGYGVARICRSCGEPAACAACGGPIASERGRSACRVCNAPGRCAACGGDRFGIERGGVERVAEWASRISPVAVAALGREEDGRVATDRVVVGTAAAVGDVGPQRLDLVALLDPDRTLARPGLHASEQALATWMEAAAWAGPRDGGGRVLVQTRHPGHPAIQALVRWDPVPLLLREAARRSEAGFPPGHAPFRVSGADGLEEELRSAGAPPLAATRGPGGTLCLVAVRPAALPAFRRDMIRLAASGIVTRVEAEPQL